jgi:hypothetical protein
MALQEFISPREAMLTGGSLVEFHEWETEAKTFVSGVTATRICRYEKEGRLNGEPYAGRGAKSIQMTRTPEGWRILSILWEDDA